MTTTPAPAPAPLPERAVEGIMVHLSAHRDRNAASLVCKLWYRVERMGRRAVFVANCYAVRPERVAERFPMMRSLTVKGKPRFADFNLLPEDWGASAHPWIEAVVKGCPELEEIRMKRMVVSDDSLELLARSFPELRSLVLVICEGFSTDGLAAIASNCRFLRELDLQENEVEEQGDQWLSCFSDSCTSLEMLNFACLKEEVNAGVLESLVERSPNLKSLKLNRSISADTLTKILAQAPQLVNVGTGSFTLNDCSKEYEKLLHVFQKCKSLRILSGFWDAAPHCLLALYPICSNLTSLNLSYAATIDGSDLIKLISQCQELQRLWVLDSIGDKGLAVVASTCKQLQELRVFPSGIYDEETAVVTEEGLVSISLGCPKLNSLLYFCHRMTNAALETVAKNCPHFTSFRLCVLDPHKPDPVTNGPLDEGFGAIVQSCKDIRRLSLGGLLTDQVFFYIGKYAESLERLSIGFAGDSDKGLVHVLNGCTKLRKLEIRDSPFGDAALLENVEKYETMHSLWMSSCNVTLGGCKALATKMARLSVEVIEQMDESGEMEENPSDLQKVEKMYVYRTVAGRRNDAPDSIWLL